MKKKVSEIIFRDDLYPRMMTSPEKVQQYAEDLSVLPPIEINRENELIDGWHRWTAHKKKEIDEIEVMVTETRDDDHLLELAIRRNAVGLMMLTVSDKKSLARRYYNVTPAEERGTKKRWLADLLKMSERTIHTWLSRIDKDSEEERQIAVQNLYLQGYTQEEIGRAVGMPQRTVTDVLARSANFQIPLIPGFSTRAGRQRKLPINW